LRSTPHKHFLKGLDALMKRKSWLPRWKNWMPPRSLHHKGQ
jgi:hypothetical protein